MEIGTTTGPAGRAVRHAADGYRMWYYGRERGFPGVTPENERSVIPMGRTGLAISRDGVQWQKVSGPGFRGSVLDPNPQPGCFDSFQVGGTDVLLWEGEYRLYYQGGWQSEGLVGTQRRKGFPLNVGLAVSPDGIHFRRVPGSLPGGAILAHGAPGEWDEWYAGFPRVTVLSDGTFRMTYSGAGRNGPAIGMADSPDGFHWEKRGPIFFPSSDEAAFDARSVGSRSIVAYRGRLLMVYEAIDAEGRFRLGMAEADEWQSWRRVAGRGPKGSLIDYGAAGSFDERAMGTPYLVPEPDGSLKLYYVGFSAQGVSGIGLLVCEGDDITRWERYR
ncbi:MAG: glycosyl hydrolase [Chloroflexota bacterium]|nr:glycosyl hydrolase [Chloroflexota bacterium]